jgi:propanediol dehydratase small subunit
VIESLVQSVEKMKMTTTTSAPSEKVSRRRIHFDHAYTKPEQIETGESKRIDDGVIKSVMNEIFDRFVHEHSHFQLKPFY